MRLFLSDMDLLFDLLEIDMCHGRIFTIEDLSQLLQSGTTGFHIEEVNEHELNEDPNGIDQRQVPVMRQVLPGNRIRITGLVSFAPKDNMITGNSLSKNQRCLYSQVHYHDSLGAQAIR